MLWVGDRRSMACWFQPFDCCSAASALPVLTKNLNRPMGGCGISAPQFIQTPETNSQIHTNCLKPLKIRGHSCNSFLHPPSPTLRRTSRRRLRIRSRAGERLLSRRQPGQPPSGASAGISAPHLEQILVILITAVFPRRVFGNADHSEEGRTSDRVGAAQE